MTLDLSAPPVAPSRPYAHEAHGDRREDPYQWLRNRDDPAVRAYLEAENAYTAGVRARFADVEDRLFAEIVGRIQETDTSAPLFFRGYWYYTRTVKGMQYAIHCRRPGTMDAAEEVLLDENVEAEGHDFYAVGVFETSPDQRLLAYADDLKGDERYTLRFRDLASGENLPDVVENVYYTGAWAADNATFFYTRPDSAMRPHQVWRHRLGTPSDDDVLVYQENDQRFHVGAYPNKSERIIVIESGSKVTSECRFIHADRPDMEPVLVAAREQGVEYWVKNHEDRLLVLTSAGGHPDFRLMSAPLAAPGKENWVEVVPERPGSRLMHFDVFRDHVALGWVVEAGMRMEVLDFATGDLRAVPRDEEASVSYPIGHPEYAGSTLRFAYTSLTTPWSTYDFDMRTGERTLVKQQPVLGGFKSEDYVSGRTWATAPDGVKVPISWVRAAASSGDDPAPCLLYGYGSYEYSTLPWFDSNILSLLDRGFVYAQAHVRGGGELGRAWYEQGKLQKKRNTFTDFIACADHLVAEGITTRDRLAIRGASAGGLLVGAVLNLRPDVCAVAVAEVPFVDALTTILDESLPLTAMEWEEWGDPRTRKFYDYMKSYSPYDNVQSADYPAMLVMAGLNDTRVSYWEPAKWVARLRAVNPGGRPLLLKTHMETGHGGPSGRYDEWRDEAFVYAFILWALGLE